MTYKLSKKEFDRFQKLLSVGWLHPNGVTAYTAVEQCGLSRSTWRRTLIALEQKGWVARYEDKMSNGATRHLYYLSTDAVTLMRKVREGKS